MWKSTDATISAYTLGGVATGTLGTPAATPGGATAGTVTLTSTQATNAAFSATTADGNATVQYATGATLTSFGAWTPTTIANGDNVWIEVTAEDGTVLVYKIAVKVLSDDATITGYDLGGVTTGTLGTPAATPGGVTTAGAVTLTSSEATNVAFSATTTHGGAAVQYATGTALTSFEAWTPATIADGDNVWIEVTAEDGTVLVYKIVVTVTPPPTYGITVGSFVGGSVGANRTSAAAGETVTLTVYPASGYELSAISVFKIGDASVTVSLNDFNGLNAFNGTFTMPDYDVTVDAFFTEIPPPEPAPEAVALDAMIYSIRSLYVIVPQEEANTELDVASWLKIYLARLFLDKGWDISVQKLTVNRVGKGNFTPSLSRNRT